MKLYVDESMKLREAVINFLSERDDDDYDERYVLATLYRDLDGLYDGWKHIVEVLGGKDNLTEEEKTTLREAKEKLNVRIDFSPADVSYYFSRKNILAAEYRKINRSLSILASNKALPFDEEKIKAALEKVGECYGIDEKGLKIIAALFAQIKIRLNTFSETGDFRRMRAYNDFGIMPVFLGSQGCGKSVLANTIGDVIGSYKEVGIDTILGTFGTLDVFSSPLIVMNEFGRQNKDSTDELKKYINGEVVGVNQKYKDTVWGQVLASFILTSNVDPMSLLGQELGSRRICIVNFKNKKPTLPLSEIREALETIWSMASGDLLEKMGWGTKEELSVGNLEEQSLATVNEFFSSLTDEEKSWLGCEKHTVGAIHHYLCMKGYKISRNFIKLALDASPDFTKKTEGPSNVFYIYNNCGMV